MRRRRAAAPYAKALFAVAKARDQMELVGRELDAATATVGSVAELRDFFARPWIQAATKRAAALDVAEGSGLSKLTGDFLGLVAARGRTDHLEAIAEQYRKFEDDDLHRARARVRSAIPLTGEARRALSAKLGPLLGGRQVALEEIVDPTMLGGFVVESGGLVLDASLEGQLEQIRHRLGQGEGGAGGETPC